MDWPALGLASDDLREKISRGIMSPLPNNGWVEANSMSVIPRMG
jgi:hypothetical protein